MKLKQILTILISIFVFAGLWGQVYAQNPNVVGMWLFEEDSGDQVADSSGNGHTGVAVDGKLEWAEGKFGKALKFGNGMTRVHVEHNDAFNLETFTIECWVKVESTGDWQTVVAKRSQGAEDTNYVVEINKTGDVPRAALASGGVWKAGLVSGATPVTDNVWHHLATTYDGKDFKFYVDGELEGTQQEAPKPDNSPAPLSIGADSYASKPVNGLIDEVQILSVALSQDEIRIDMQGLKPAAVEPWDKLTTTWGSIRDY